MSKHSDAYEEHYEDLYSIDFFSKLTKCRGWQKDVALRIAKEFNIQSVCDFGCASGFYLDGFREHGCFIKGYEYCYQEAKPFMNSDTAKWISKANCMEPIFAVYNGYDMTMSIEVGEHLLPDSSDTFIDNLVRASKKYILFSSASPKEGKQTGTGHINERPLKLWIEDFESYEFMYSEEDTKKVRKCFNDCEIGSHYKYCLSKEVTMFRRS